MGHDAWQMIGRTPGDIVAERPLRQGAITDFDVTQRMIRLLLHRVRVGRFNRPRVVVCVPSAITPVERRAVREAARRAGANDAVLIGQPMAAAIGVGPADPRAGRQPGHRRRRRHDRDRAHLARRGGGARRGAGRQLRHRHGHPGLRAARVRHRRGRADGRGDQGRHRLGLAGARRAEGRGPGPGPGVRAAQDGHPDAGRDPGGHRRRDRGDRRLRHRLPGQRSAGAGPRPHQPGHGPGGRGRDAGRPRPADRATRPRSTSTWWRTRWSRSCSARGAASRTPRPSGSHSRPGADR